MQQDRAGDRILRTNEVCRKIGFSRATVYRLTREDSSFPKKIKIGVRACGWFEREIDTWLAKRAADTTPAVSAE